MEIVFSDAFVASLKRLNVDLIFQPWSSFIKSELFA